MRAIRERVRARLAGQGPDAGLSLLEVVVSMSIGALLLALVTGFTVRELRTIDYSDKRATAESQIGTAQEAIAQQTRTMVAFPSTSLLSDPNGDPVNGPVVASAETVGFFSYLTSTSLTGTSLTPVREVWFWVRTSGGKRQLCTQTRNRTRSAADSGTLAAATPDLSVVGNRTCRVLVDNLAAAISAKPLFRYVTGDYDPLSGAPTNDVLVSAPATDSTTMRALYVDLRVDAGTKTHPVVVEKATLVQLLNKIGRNP